MVEHTQARGRGTDRKKEEAVYSTRLVALTNLSITWKPFKALRSAGLEYKIRFKIILVMGKTWRGPKLLGPESEGSVITQGRRKAELEQQKQVIDEGIFARGHTKAHKNKYLEQVLVLCN